MSSIPSEAVLGAVEETLVEGMEGNASRSPVGAG
jgi:hypothetical protein